MADDTAIKTDDGQPPAVDGVPDGPKGEVASEPSALPPAASVPASQPTSGRLGPDESSGAGPLPQLALKVAYRPSYVFLALVTVLNLGFDLWTKHWATSHFDAMRAGESRRLVVFEDVATLGMSFIFAKNRGGAWGLLQNETESLRRPFFLVVSVAAIVFIVSLYRKLTPGQRALMWGLPLVLGGALGNLVDRIRYGYVVDFIDVYMTMEGEVKHWPTFNVADIAICVGVGLMAIDMFTTREKKRASSASRTAVVADEPPSQGA